MPSANELHRQLLDRLLTDGFGRAAGSLLNQMADLPPNIQQRLKDLDAEAERLKQAGLMLPPDSAYLRALLADTETWLNGQRAQLDQQGARIQLDGADAGQSVAQQLTGLYTDDAYKAQAAQILLGWNRVSADQLASLLDLVGTDAWRSQLGGFSTNVLDTLTEVTIRGFIEGWNPLKTALELRKVTEAMPYVQAENLLRTLYNVSSRRGMQAVYLANTDILEYQIRVATLDNRVCFPAGTMIETIDGQKPIESIKVGDVVRTHTGSFKRVYETMKRPYAGKASILRTANTAVTATANHPILVDRMGNRDWIAAEDCRVGERVFLRRDYRSGNVDHLISDRAIERHVWNTNDIKTFSNQTINFPFVGFGASVPVDPIHFKSEVQSRQVEVNRVAINPRFLFKRLIHRFKAQAHVPLRFGLARVAPIATRVTELLMCQHRNNSKLFAARQTSNENRRTATSFRAMRARPFFVGIQKHLAAALASNINIILRFAFATANGIPLGVGFGNTKRLFANRANLSNRVGVLPTLFSTIFSAAFFNLAWSARKFFTATLASKGSPILLGFTPTSVAAKIRRGIAAPLSSDQWDATDGASVFIHDTIISNSSLELKCDVYNFEVEDDHSYIANGLAVHNCIACIALHGTTLRLDEPVLDHHRGRCVSVVKIKNIPLSVPTGVDWFGNLPEGEQRTIMGHAAYEAWKAGAVQLRDFVKPYQDDLFGEMIQAASLKGILGEAAKQYYKNP